METTAIECCELKAEASRDFVRDMGILELLLDIAGHLQRSAKVARQTLSLIVYEMNGSTKSTPPQNRELIVYYHQIKP